LAEVEDIPGDLRSLARRVPENIRVNLSVLELRLRCEEASALLAEADAATDQVKADRLRAKGGRILRAISPGGFKIATDTMEAELREAELAGDRPRVHVLQEEIRAFARRNPQVSEERIRQAAEAAIFRQIHAVKESPRHSRLFSRRVKRG
jgi:hypothetical protein